MMGLKKRLQDGQKRWEAADEDEDEDEEAVGCGCGII